ncbi:MAG: fibronectin type III domain-containing protein, partial [Candidatus Marinimicrobia bacterium]|nr:fibronectin type III domain-containing protein [Candidatus Neomarinimicrobiota bacterium]
ASATVDITPKFSGPIWWVATDGNDNTNEGSATSPFLSIAHAIEDAADGDTITIKPGTYTGSNNRDLDPEGKNLVIMSQYPTTWDSVIIDGNQQMPHFYFSNQNSTASISYEKTKLIGLTLINGSWNSGGQNDGIGASVKVEGDNTVTFEKVLFKDNELWDNGQTHASGAVLIDSPGSKFYYCRFENNRSLGGNNAGSTGAIGIGGDGGNNSTSTLYTLIEGCEFVGNQGRNEGGAINARHNTVIRNSLFYQNKVGENYNGHGGAIAAMPRKSGDGDWAYDTYLHVINCTFVENLSAGSGGAISHYGSNPPVIFNSIFLNNYREFDSGNPMLDNFSAGGSGSENQIIIDYSSLVWNDNDNQETNFGSNIYTDIPLFTDTTKENFTLTSASTLIGAGTTSFEGVSAPTKDINGNTRPNPSGSNPDLGAYENSLAESPFPSQVKNVTATIGSQSVNLSWDANIETDIEKYLIYMSETFGFEPTSEDSIGESATSSFSATGLTNSMEYYFRVAAVDSNGYRGAFSQEISAMPQYMGPTWWVDINGNDMNDGSQSSPFYNLNYAFSQIANGDTIILTETGQHDINKEIGGDALSNLTEFHLRGSTGNPKDVSISGNSISRHFSLQNKIATFKYITFKNGVAHEGTGGGGGGSFIIGPGTETRVNFDNCIFYKNQSDGSSWGSGGAILLDNVQEAKFVNCIFRE